MQATRIFWRLADVADGSSAIMAKEIAHIAYVRVREHLLRPLPLESVLPTLSCVRATSVD